MRNNHVLRILSYAFDWAIIVVAIIIEREIGKIAGHRQRFSLEDITLQYSFGGPSTVSGLALILLSVGFPVVAIAILTLLLEKPALPLLQRIRASLYTLNGSLLGLALSVTLSQTFTNALKISIGRPRPDLLARCIPAANAANAIPYGLTTSAICTQTNVSLMNDGFRSFPSGHSSTAFSGLAYLTLFLAWRLSLFNRRGEVWKWIVVAVPALLASFIAISRIIDNRHHPTDILFGSALGIVTSTFAFYQYHQTLSDVKARYPLRFPNENEPSQLTSSRTIGGEATVPILQRTSEGPESTSPYTEA